MSRVSPFRWRWSYYSWPSVGLESSDGHAIGFDAVAADTTARIPGRPNAA
jgi:hypothetical protein